MTPHKHHDLIVAWAKGAQIQYKDKGTWYACAPQPAWTPSTRYRIKPEPKPKFILYVSVGECRPGAGLPDVGQWAAYSKNPYNNVKLIFDGETGKLKKAEVIDEA